MCVSPITIKNNSSYIHTHYCKADYTVPCGHCYECQCAKVSDWQVRCTEHMKNSAQSYFYTLTYAPGYIDTYGIYPDGSPRYVFNKRHVQLFLKRFRKRLSALGVSLKYMIVGELGELTHRPHYHAVFFLDKAINPFEFRLHVRDAWSLGFVQPGDNLGLIYNSNAICYVIKYMQKTDTYVEGFEYHLARVLMFKWYRNFRTLFPDISRPRYGYHYDLHDQETLPENEVLWNNFYDAARREFRSMCNFHLQSTNLGIPDDWSDYSGLTCSIRTHDGSLKTVRTPLYYIRQQYYDRLPNFKDGYKTLYRLNSEGLVFYSKQVPEKLSRRLEDCRCALDYLKKNPDDLSVYEGVNVGIADITHWLSLHSVDEVLRNYSIYSVFYKGVVFEGRKTDLNCFQDISLNPCRFYLVYKARLHNNSSDIISHRDFLDSYESFKNREVSKHVVLEPYSILDVIVLNIKRKISTKNASERMAKLISIRRARQALYQI